MVAGKDAAWYGVRSQSAMLGVKAMVVTGSSPGIGAACADTIAIDAALAASFERSSRVAKRCPETITLSRY
jgi:hypothetical protein